MRREQLFDAGSVARGLALVAGLSLGGVAVGQLSGALTDVTRAALPVCKDPIEITTRAGTRLGCADRPEVAACGPLTAGVRVSLPDCKQRSMSAAARLLENLPLDVNLASAAELQLLDGIGPRKADAIVADRGLHGPFRTLGELARVRGIGPATVEKLTPYLTVVPLGP